MNLGGSLQMKLTELKIGKSIEIFVNREGYRYRLISKIEEVEKSYIHISLIASGNRVFQFQEEDEIEFIYRDEDRMWIFSQIKGKIVEHEGELCHALHTVRAGKSFNRRNAYRVPMNLIHEYCYYITKAGVTKAQLEEANRKGLSIEECGLYDKVEKKCYIKDLSEEGIGIYTIEDLPLNRELTFYLPSSYGFLKCKAIILREDGDAIPKFRNHYGCVFIETDRRLSKYIFELQREYIKNVKKENKKG